MNLFKECMGTFATGVTVITTRKAEGITVNSFCSLSLDPPLILFNLEKKAARFEAFHKCDDFFVNILSEHQRIVSQEFAKGTQESWKEYFDEDHSLPILKGILCYIHCIKHHTYDGGDHKIIVGKVENMKKISEEQPLIYYQGNYHQIQHEEN